MFIPCVIGYGQILVVVFVVLLLFGGHKIPELMRGLGRGAKEFKDAVNRNYLEEDISLEDKTSRKKGCVGEEQK